MKAVPFDKSFIERLARKYPTPFYIYDEAEIISRARLLKSTMKAAGVPGFRNYFAVKALPNPEILKTLKQTGMGLDCSAMAELELAVMAGFKGEDIMFTSNNTQMEEFKRASKLGAVINFDDISFVEPYLRNFGLPKVACCRYNPGDIEFGGVNEDIIGKPSQAKYGMTKAQIIEAYKLIKRAGVKRFGLHTMLLSNELDWQNHERIAELLFKLAVDISEEAGIQFEFINLGGGLGVPYTTAQHDFDLGSYAKGLAKLYEQYEFNTIGSPAIVTENGRYVTAPAGYLVTTAINRKDTHKVYLGVDASMSNLMRPGMYGAYHHITILGKEDLPATEAVDIVGSLCENNDKFAVDRELPTVKVGDILVIHTVGAHGHAMGFQYNGKLRSAELLLKADKSVQLIRRAETVDDYFATLIK